jgi:molecular chaperone DnaK (HSP70)
VLAFWGIFSLPTNAHTLYLQENAIEVVKKDLTKAQKELDNLSNREIAIIDQDQKIKNVRTLLSDLEVEYLNPSRRGLGWRCDTIIARIENELSNTEEKFKIDKSRGRTAKESFEHIERQVENKLDNSVIKDLTERFNISEEHQIQMKATSRKINNLLKHIDKMNPSTAVEKSQKPLESACSLLETYTKKAEHKFDNTETAKLKNVYGVLFSWFRGDLKGQGFAIWFVISILIDLAGFLFATIAFRNTISKKIFN